jgi:hypothetical protein
LSERGELIQELVKEIKGDENEKWTTCS